MTYTIITPKVVQKQLDALPNHVYERIVVPFSVSGSKIATIKLSNSPAIL